MSMFVTVFAQPGRSEESCMSTREHGRQWEAGTRFAGMYDNDPVAEVPEDKKEKVLGGRGSVA